MKAMRLGLVLAVMAVAGLPASAAAAQSLVPPGNSGVNQYKETLPGVGGDELPAGKHRSPEKALGAANAHRLEQLGPAGRAAAALAAATAPPRNEVADRGDGGHSSSSVEPGGSSGLGEVLGQATGSTSSGEMGLLLPLVIVAAVLGALLFAGRRRAARSS